MASHARDGVLDPGSSRSARVVAAVPDAFLVVLAGAAAIGVLASLLHLEPLDAVGPSRLVAAVLVALGAAALVVRSADRRAPGAGLLPALPALVHVGYAAAVRFVSPGDRAEWFLGGDHVRHLLFVADERVAGNLDYVAQPYPRAWHTVVAASWSATGAHPDASGLRSLVDLLSTAAWLLPAVLSLATASLTVALARRCGASHRRGDLAGLGAGATMLLPPFLANYQALGFENSYVGAIVLAVAAREVVLADRARRGWAVGIGLVGLVVAAHSWQLLLPAAGVAFLHVAWPVLRRGSVRARVALAVASVVAAAVALPALLAVFVAIGVQHATDSGVDAPVPWLLLVLGLACAGAMVLRRRSDRSVAILLVVLLLPGLTAVGLAARVGIPLTDYYPSKLLWHSAVLGLSPLAVGIVVGADRLGRLPASGPLRLGRGVAMVAAGLALAYAFVSPAGAFVGAWSSVRGPLLLDAITSPGAGQAQVVWLGTKGDDTIGRVLLDFYRIPDTARTPQPPLDVTGDCALLRVAQRPAVLSDRPGEEVRARYGCVPDLTVVPVRRGG